MAYSQSTARARHLLISASVAHVLSRTCATYLESFENCGPGNCLLKRPNLTTCSHATVYFSTCAACGRGAWSKSYQKQLLKSICIALTYLSVSCIWAMQYIIFFMKFVILSQSPSVRRLLSLHRIMTLCSPVFALDSVPIGLRCNISGYAILNFILADTMDASRVIWRKASQRPLNLCTGLGQSLINPSLLFCHRST